MKYIIAVIQPQKLEAVKQALETGKMDLMTATETIACGHKSITEVYRGVKEVGNMVRMIKLEIAVNDDSVEATIQAISNAARSDEVGVGRIFVLDLKDCIRIRTMERGSALIN